MVNSCIYCACPSWSLHGGSILTNLLLYKIVHEKLLRLWFRYRQVIYLRVSPATLHEPWDVKTRVVPSTYSLLFSKLKFAFFSVTAQKHCRTMKVPALALNSLKFSLLSTNNKRPTNWGQNTKQFFPRLYRATSMVQLQMTNFYSFYPHSTADPENGTILTCATYTYFKCRAVVCACGNARLLYLELCCTIS